MTWRPSFYPAFNLTDQKRMINRILGREHRHPHQKIKPVLFVIAFFLLLPVFFQLSNGIFTDASFYFSSGGILSILPIPFSIIMCGIGIVYLGELTKARLTITILLLTCLSVLLTTVLLGMDFKSIENSKLILLAQYILPMCALVLGQQYGSRPGAITIMAKAFTLILLFTVPAQLMTTWAHGMNILSPSLFLFSAYQHLQYIPVIFAGAFLVAIFTLWEFPTYRLLLSALAGLMGAYISLSHSILAIGLLTFGLVCFSGRTILLRKNRLHASVTTMLAVFILIVSASSNDSKLSKEKLGVDTPSTAQMNESDTTDTIDNAVLQIPLDTHLEIPNIVNKPEEEVLQTPRNLTERATYLKFYINEIFQTPNSILLGHHEPPDRNVYPSAHNYYLDFIYNFGVLAIVPLLGLATFTIYSVIRNFPRVFSSSKIVGIVGVVLFLVFVDNMFKVGMRQPYPGIMTFYLWGVLLALLLKLKKRRL
ncbi:hypothetical protein [Pseudomonas sp. PD9R]|uniref:hypothetical protein n=1 Tax=Pseudomonas sp. PD9R TaxID=2853534 RepID=UPI001C496B8F|nr:hypothetical protein [Pseudomonas sp. PD9R]MBV6826570.1 hypothetical protein [Pseudomonas sp. PD9R]